MESPKLKKLGLESGTKIVGIVEARIFSPSLSLFLSLSPLFPLLSPSSYQAPVVIF
jgi:hypothetical protein